MEKFIFSKALKEAIVLKKMQIPKETIEAPEKALVPNNKETLIFNKRSLMTHLHIQYLLKYERAMMIMIQNHVQYMNVDKGTIGQN